MVLPSGKDHAIVGDMSHLDIQRGDNAPTLDEHVAVLRDLERQRAELEREYGERYIQILTVYHHRPAHLARQLGVTDASVVKRRDRFISYGWGGGQAA